MALKFLFFQDSDGDKSDDNLVVDVSNEVTILLIKLYFQSDLGEKGSGTTIFWSFATLHVKDLMVVHGWNNKCLKPTQTFVSFKKKNSVSLTIWIPKLVSGAPFGPVPSGQSI